MIAHRWSPGGRLTVTLDDGRVIEAVVIKQQAGRYEVWIDGERHLVAQERKGRSGHGSNESDDALVAPMPAKVVRLNVKPGDAVEDGQTLVVLESMKMELGVTAPRSGKVQKVGAEVGAIVPAGAVLVELEPAGT